MEEQKEGVSAHLHGPQPRRASSLPQLLRREGEEGAGCGGTGKEQKGQTFSRVEIKIDEWTGRLLDRTPANKAIFDKYFRFDL
jgi:hypothetical protein